MNQKHTVDVLLIDNNHLHRIFCFVWFDLAKESSQELQKIKRLKNLFFNLISAIDYNQAIGE